VRIGLANSYLAMAIRAAARTGGCERNRRFTLNTSTCLPRPISSPGHHDAQALTSFAQASNAEGEDQSAEQSLLQRSHEGLRSPRAEHAFYFSVTQSSRLHRLCPRAKSTPPLPCRRRHVQAAPPRSSCNAWTDAYHVHLAISHHWRLLPDPQRARANLGPRAQLRRQPRQHRLHLNVA